MAEPTKSGRILGWISAGVSYALCRYFGANSWVPLIAAIALWFLIGKAAPSRRSVRPAASFLGAHLAWMVAAVLYAPAMLSNVLLDVIFLGTGLAWLLIRPGRAAIVFVGVVEAASLVVNLVAVADQPFGQARTVRSRRRSF